MTKTRWTILILSCRNPETDFRKPLADQLEVLGHDVCYVWLKRRPLAYDVGSQQPAREFGFFDFVKYVVGRFRARQPLLVVNSTNLVFPITSAILKCLIGGVWCFDMHDDLLYDEAGARRAILRMYQWLLLKNSDLLVHAAPTLKELFPRSHHLGNASSITPLKRPNVSFANVLILASLDTRFDFDFLSQAARLYPELQFHVYGYLPDKPAGISKSLKQLLRTHDNIEYFGAYVSSDLPRILSEYSVTLAPYVTNSTITRYIDPLRFYHCLNSGMEIISTQIPRAEDLRDVLHVVTTPMEVGILIHKLGSSNSARLNRATPIDAYNWRDKAIKLVGIVGDYGKHKK